MMIQKLTHKTVLMSSFALALLSIILYREYAWERYGFGLTSVYFTIIALYFLMMLLTASIGSDKYQSLPVPKGRTIAIIPSYNEPDENVHHAVKALLNGTLPPDEIHVVDDGSVKPLKPFKHPKVFWHKQSNGGKRSAQTLVLSKIKPGKFDYLITVDSDSRVAPTAIEDSLRPFNDPSIQAVTSTVTIRNRTTSLITLLADLEIVTGVFVVRRARSYFGAVAPTSGALSVYRIDTILENLHDYLHSGTFSDDRRMAHYSLLKGKVISVNGAVVDTDMPHTFKGTWRQRVRWYKGYWKYLPWEAAHLSGWPLFMRYMSTLNAVVFPFAFFWIAIYLPITGRGIFWPVLILWLALLYAQSASYLMRPNINIGTKVLTWLLATPLLIPYQVLLVRPAMYWAAITATNTRWNGHRETASNSTTIKK